MFTTTETPLLSGLGMKLLTKKIVWKWEGSDKVIKTKSLVLKSSRFECGLSSRAFWFHKSKGTA